MEVVGKENEKFRLMDMNGKWSEWFNSDSITKNYLKNKKYKAIQIQTTLTREQYEKEILNVKA
jgi:hypothetical protein